MRPGGELKPHQDTNVAARWPHKIHVPILSNDRVAFWIDGKAYHLPVGEAFALAAAMQRLCEDAGLRQAMGVQSRRMAVERFSCGTVNRDIVALLEKGVQ